MPKKLSDFIAAASKDRTAVIRAYLRKLGARYVGEVELCKAIGMGYQQVAQYRDAFKDHLVPTRNRASRPAFLWAGTPKLAKQMREVTRA